MNPAVTPSTKGAEKRFQNRNRYRLRRVADAARLLPIAGAVLLLIPLWLDQSDAVDTAARTSNVAFYIFGVWAVLILAALLLSRSLHETRGPGQAKADEGAL